MRAKLGPYRVLRLLDVGGQSRVYLGYDERLQRRVAIKVRPLPYQRETRLSLLREARLCAALDSISIVRVFDVIESDTHLGIVMEYVSGCTLDKLLSSVRLTLPSIVTVARDLAVALTCARQAGVVHGDVKAGNVLITRDGHAKLLDFGTSRQRMTHSRQTCAGGSLSALSPEYFIHRQQDHRSDLFALGVLLYRMVAGVHPFFTEGHFDLHSLLEKEPLHLSRIKDGEQVPVELADLVQGLLQKNPAERVDTTLRVRQVLLDVTRRLPVTEAGSLRREVAPYVCVDAKEELPQGLSGGLDSRERFHCVEAGGWLDRFGHCLRISRRCRKGVVVLMAAVGLAAPVTAALYYSATAVRFSVPTLVLQGSPLPSQRIDQHWLLAEVQAVLVQELGQVDVVGEVGVGVELQRTVYSPSALLQRPQVADEAFGIVLRCVDGLCVFAVNRLASGRRVNRQSVLLAEMSTAEWARSVRSTTRELFE